MIVLFMAIPVFLYNFYYKKNNDVSLCFRFIDDNFTMSNSRVIYHIYSHSTFFAGSIFSKVKIETVISIHFI